MTSHDSHTVVVDQTDPRRGRFDASRIGRENPDDAEPRPIVTPEDRQATREELAELRRRMSRKRA